MVMMWLFTPLIQTACSVRGHVHEYVRDDVLYYVLTTCLDIRREATSAKEMSDESDDIDLEQSFDDVPDRSTVESEDLEAGMPSGHMHCDDCGDTMPTSPGQTSEECSCGHAWRLHCTPANMMDEL